MKNSGKSLLLEQLKLSYPELNIVHFIDKRGEIEINDTPYKGIKIVISARLDFNFKSFDMIDFEALSTYFKPRLKFTDCRIYYNYFQINIYLDKKFLNNKKGEFEKAMWTFKVIEHFKGQIKAVVGDILDDQTP